MYSSSIPFSNPELLYALNHAPRVMHRMELLQFFSDRMPAIFVAGSHGKSTTTGLLGHIFLNAGRDPDIVLGAKADYLGGKNFRVGNGSLLVCEVDESDGSFVGLGGETVVITNIDFEHPDYYRNVKELTASYRAFIERNARLKNLFLCAHDKNSMALHSAMRPLRRRSYAVYRYGFTQDSDVSISKTLPPCYSFKGKKYGALRPLLLGAHNTLNIGAAVGVALRYRIPWPVIAHSVNTFAGVRRRLEQRLSHNNILILDDYGHHPREIQATIEAIRQRKPKRLLCVFQPHRYSRFGYLWNDFLRAFGEADKVFVTDVYSAGEKKIPGVDSQRFVRHMKRRGIDYAYYLRYNTLPSMLVKHLCPGDTVAMFGAGDIIEASARLSELVRRTT